MAGHSHNVSLVPLVLSMLLVVVDNVERRDRGDSVALWVCV